MSNLENDNVLDKLEKAYHKWLKAMKNIIDVSGDELRKKQMAFLKAEGDWQPIDAPPPTLENAKRKIIGMHRVKASVASQGIFGGKVERVQEEKQEAQSKPPRPG